MMSGLLKRGSVFANEHECKKPHVDWLTILAMFLSAISGVGPSMSHRATSRLAKHLLHLNSQMARKWPSITTSIASK